MEKRNGLPRELAWPVLIVALAVVAGMFCSWRLPGLELYARDWLMRQRGTIDEPDDVAIVAVDEASISKLGRFPWPRDLSAKVLGNVSAGQPKAIALDIIYAEPTDPSADESLADAIRKAGNVVIGEQLIVNRETPELGRSEWLKSLPVIETAAAGAGHVNVETESDGAARELLLRLADDEGEARWALAAETVRVGDNLDGDAISETRQYVRIGARKIPFTPAEQNYVIRSNNESSRLMTSHRLPMIIDYIGPTGSFTAQTYSFSDVLEAKIPPEAFRGKYVLIGATAATLGDRIATPFVHTENPEGDQHGDLMPGVEILANEINTILRGRFYQPVSDWTAIFLTALTAFAVVLLLRMAQGRNEALKQIGVLAVLSAFVLFASYLIFVYALIIPPIVPMIVSLFVAAPLAFLRQSLSASFYLDQRIDELITAESQLFPAGNLLSADANRPRSEGGNKSENYPSAFNTFLPRGLESKSERLGFLSRDLVNHAGFIDSALRSIADGLLIADCRGQIAFANQTALRIFDVAERQLIGADIFATIAGVESGVSGTGENARAILRQLVTEERTSVEREIVIGKKDAHYYLLRMGAVVSRDQNGTLGIIATLSDVTYHRELQRTKNDVITLVTHELRTPLTAIQGMSEVLTEHEVDREQRRKMLTTINEEAKRLANMVNEYLDVTRLEAGVVEAHFSTVDIFSLIERTLLMLDPLAAKRDIKIVRTFDSDRISINADPARLTQMLTNIVANAVKYSPPDSTVSVITRIEENKVKIDVIDHGYGINAEELPRIFEKFYRSPRRTAEEITGTGLGLALAKEIAELHKGDITVVSKLNNGSIFTISLPLSF